MTVLFYLSFFLILYTYAGYPLLIAALARLRPRAWHRSPWPRLDPAPVSVIMAVHNGASMIPVQMAHLTTLEPDLIKEIIVVSDGSTDFTPALLQASTDPRLRVILLPEHSGKSTALNHGIAAATAEILLFIDIRPKVEAGALPALLSNFADPTVGCVAGELLLSTSGHDATASAVSGLYWRYEQWMRNCEAAFDSPTGVYGGFYAIRRALATPFPPGLILDDMFQPLSIIRQGYRSVLDRSAFVLDTWPSTSAGEFSRKIRTLCGNFQLIAEAPWLLTPRNRVLFQLVSHKLLRLVVPYAFVALFFSSVILSVRSAPHTTFPLILALMQAAFWILAFASLYVRVPGPLGKLANPAGAMLVLNAAAVSALFRFLFTRGPLWKTWNATPAPTGPRPS